MTVKTGHYDRIKRLVTVTIPGRESVFCEFNLVKSLMIKPAEFVYSFIHVTLSYDFFLTLGACEKIFKEINFLRGKNSRILLLGVLSEF